jgi:hypothetical protein
MNDDTVLKQLCTWSALGVLGDALTRIQALYCDLFGQGSKNAFELAEVGKTLRHFATEYRKAVQALSGTIESENGEVEAETEDFELLYIAQQGLLRPVVVIARHHSCGRQMR